LELDFGFVVVLKVEAGALAEADAFLEETLEDTETFFDDTEALMDDTLEETDAFLDETLLETEDFWGPLDETEGLCETEALVEEAFTETLEDEEIFLEETLAESELFFDETDALIEDTLDETDAFLEETEGLGPTLVETDTAELWLVATPEDLAEELMIVAAIEGLRVDDADMVLFMATLSWISLILHLRMRTTYMGALMGLPAAFI